jgi:hypothetical protein
MRDDCFSQAFEDQVETTQCVAPISRPKFYSVQLWKRLIYELDDRGPLGGCGTPIGGILQGRMVLETYRQQVITSDLINKLTTV